jgi:predicted dehydrogenase
MPFLRKMKELIDDGAIGEVKAGWCRHFLAYGCDAYFKDWHADQKGSFSLLLQKGAHDIDNLHWLMGGYTTRVTGLGALTLYGDIKDRRKEDEPPDTKWKMENWPPLSQKGLNPIIDVEDLSMVLMQMENGMFASYQQCHYTPDAWRNYCIIGTEGRVENCGDYHGECNTRLWNKRIYYSTEGDENYNINLDAAYHGGADPKIVAEFVRFARDGGSISIPPIAARNSVAAGYSAAQSIREGGMPKDIPPVDPDLLEYFNNPQ